MKSKKLREEFLSFFESKGHTRVDSSSLIPDDGSVLFTTAGMQQFKDYYVDKESPYGTRTTSSQRCFRTSDIEEVGDKDHLTFLEMLGNFSFGDYFKEETIKWALEFLTERCGIEKERLIFTYFKGEKGVPIDEDSKEIWKSLGAEDKQLVKLGMEDNFWGPTGNSGPCGPTTEIHYDLTGSPCSEDCGLECECGRYVEIWNLVFNEFYQDENGELSPLKKKGVDTGMGLERLAMVVQGKSHVFETDLFTPLIEKIDFLKKEVDPKSKRIIADHIKAASFLISEKITPSNTDRGYILRRLLRRSMRHAKLVELPENSLEEVTDTVFDIYGEFLGKKEDVLKVIKEEREKFEKALDVGLKEFEKAAQNGELSGKEAFHLYSTYGFPLELIEELCEEEEIEFTKKGFEKEKEKHQEISRKGADEKFGGLSKNPEKEEVKLHTATHLLHESLRRVLGEHVKQMGSHITSKRLRFDFSHPESMTDKEIEKVEEMVNQMIEKDLKREIEEMSYDEAIEKGALSFFEKEKYPEKVKVYSFVDGDGKAFTKELCGGPHVESTGQMGKFKIKKEKSSSKGVRRIKAILI